jgi:uncharacterized protein (TIGR00730 family)
VRVCVYCAKSSGNDPRAVEVAREFGVALARDGMTLVYGGSRVGLMGALAESALNEGGEVIGIIPQFLEDREVANPAVDLRIVTSMHERKQLMADLSDVFVALPGGFGTFEEFFEIVTWVQLGLIDAPCLLANIDGYYDPLLALVDSATSKGFISAAHRAIVESYASIDDVMRRLRRCGTAGG